MVPRMHVGIDCRYIRERPSGIGAYIQALVDRLPHIAPSARFLFWADRRASRPLSHAPNVDETTVRAGANSPLSTLWPRAYASVDHLDLFHSPHNILLRGIKCASVVTVHDVMALDGPWLDRRGIERLSALYYPQAVRRALRHATRLIVPTAATADRVLAWQPDAGRRLRVIPLAPDTCFQPAADIEAARRRARTLIGCDAPYVLVVGQNNVNKRHAAAMLAFAAAAPPPWRLVLLQRLGRPTRLKRLAVRLSLADRAVWLRNVPRAEVAALMQAAAVLMQPSLYEGFGLPAVEAMASGCPVIASDIPSLREVTGGATLLVAPDDLSALAQSLRELLTSPERRLALAAQGLTRARAFSWERTARETLAVYEEAAVLGRPAACAT